MVRNRGQAEFCHVAQLLPFLAEPLAHFIIQQRVTHAVGHKEGGQPFAQQGAGVHAVRLRGLNHDVEQPRLRCLHIHHATKNRHRSGQQRLTPSAALPPMLARFLLQRLHGGVERHEPPRVRPRQRNAGLVNPQARRIVVYPGPGIQTVLNHLFGRHLEAGARAVLGQQADNAAAGQVHGPGDKLLIILQRPHAAVKKHHSRLKRLRRVARRGKETHTQLHPISKALPHKGRSLIQQALVAGLTRRAGSARKSRHKPSLSMQFSCHESKSDVSSKQL